MTTARNSDGTIDVRVVLTVRIDPGDWVADVMHEHPDEVLVTEVRRDVKAYIRELIVQHEPTRHIIRDASVQGVYPQEV